MSYAGRSDSRSMTSPVEIDDIFAPIAEAVTNFAQHRSMELNKCPRGNSGWELTQPHPAGGEVFLLLLHDESLGLGIGSVWQFPCPEMSLQYSHFRPVCACALDPQAVTAALGVELGEIMQVRFGYWTHIRPLEQ